MSIFANIAWKVLSLVVAFGLWLMVMSTNSIEITKEVELDLNLPADLVVANDVPTHVSFRLQGSKLFLRTLANNLDVIRVDLTRAKAGPAYYRIERDSLRLPIGIKVLSISPSTINPMLEPVLDRTVPVSVISKNQLPSGYRLVKLVAEPTQVKIKGPRSQVEKITSLRPPAVDLAEVPANLRWEIALTPPSAQIVFDETVEPKVVVEVEPKGSNFRIAGVPLVLVGDRKATLNVDKVALYVSCPANILQTLTPDKVKAVVNMGNSSAGTYSREVKVELPAGVKLVRVVPDRVQVQVQ
jgi:YbbR domain-containing protein